MNQDTNHEGINTSLSNKIIDISFDEFNISEDSFKPMTKGLGFHQEQKRSSFTPAPKKEIKSFGKSQGIQKVGSLLNSLSEKSATAVANQMPSGLEAFYGTKGNPGNQTNQSVNFEDKKIDLNDVKVESKTIYKTASAGTQFLAWMVDLLVAVTGALLVLASGIQYKVFARLISMNDLIAFTTAIFSIYYLLYFTILDLTASPGKTILGVRLLRTDNGNVTVKHTFTRSLVSLLSVVALFLPMLLDFQGRLSDTKIVR